ncbi:MAG TPA: hypothetical protein VHF27_10380 [Acidimicrobiales bacterium]|nr:hypothetical protein [Acidimicrobiales bacterium]
MADDLPLVLALLHDSDKRWTTLRAEGEEWVDGERSKEAFFRSVRPGSVVTSRGAPGPEDRDPRWKLWARQPDRSRVDFGIAHGQRILVVADGSRMCSSIPFGGYRVSDRGEHDPSLGPAAPLVRPFALPTILDLEVLGRDVELGRPVVVVRGRPRPDTGMRGRGLTLGADELRFAVDAERGVLLWLESRYEGVPFRRLTVTDVAFDEELDDHLFAFPDDATDAGDLPVPPEPQRPARPDRLHPGPPDHVLGRPVPTLVVVARAPSLVVAVDRVVAYPNGFELGVTVRTREDPVSGSLDTGRRRSWSGTAAFPGESLTVRLGADLTVVPVTGSGTQARFDQRYWVAPLPPPGPLPIAVEWPARNLPETRADLDGEAIVEAAARAETLWP